MQDVKQVLALVSCLKHNLVIEAWFLSSSEDTLCLQKLELLGNMLDRKIKNLVKHLMILTAASRPCD